jgi:hypothetical protein
MPERASAPIPTPYRSNGVNGEKCGDERRDERCEQAAGTAPSILPERHDTLGEAHFWE